MVTTLRNDAHNEIIEMLMWRGWDRHLAQQVEPLLGNATSHIRRPEIAFCLHLQCAFLPTYTVGGST